MLAIIWALDSLRNYLYGAKKIKIVTDHQPLTFSLSNKNHNAKLKRWKSRLEEYNYELVYKPGCTNRIADALSRLEIEANHLSTDGTIHSAEQDGSDLIPYCDAPINVFKNQLIFTENKNVYAYEEPHPNYHRHFISLREITKENLKNTLKERLNPTTINGVKIPEQYIQILQELYTEHFTGFKIRLTQRVVQDIKNEENKFRIIQEEHKRAHRNWKENKEQILERYYFPHLANLIKKYTRNCEICHTSKYDRHPDKVKLQPTPIPSYPTEIIHIDIIDIKKEKFITCIDKFSKFTKLFHIKDRSAPHIRDKIIKILHYFTTPKIMVMDNESSFISPMVSDYIKTLGIQIYLTPSQKSEVNGTVERVHSTIIEMIRCLQDEFKDLPTKEQVNISVDRYNNTIHSVIGRKPSDVFFGRTNRINYQNMLNYKDKVNADIIQRIQSSQQTKLQKENLRKPEPKSYEVGDTIYVAIKQIQAKDKAKFRKETVAKNNKVTVITASGKKIHKTHIKNIAE